VNERRVLRGVIAKHEAAAAAVEKERSELRSQCAVYESDIQRAHAESAALRQEVSERAAESADLMARIHEAERSLAERADITTAAHEGEKAALASKMAEAEQRSAVTERLLQTELAQERERHQRWEEETRRAAADEQVRVTKLAVDACREAERLAFSEERTRLTEQISELREQFNTAAAASLNALESERRSAAEAAQRHRQQVVDLRVGVEEEIERRTKAAAEDVSSELEVLKGLHSDAIKALRSQHEIQQLDLKGGAEAFLAEQQKQWGFEREALVGELERLRRAEEEVQALTARMAAAREEHRTEAETLRERGAEAVAAVRNEYVERLCSADKAAREQVNGLVAQLKSASEARARESEEGRMRIESLQREWADRDRAVESAHQIQLEEERVKGRELLEQLDTVRTQHQEELRQVREDGGRRAAEVEARLQQQLRESTTCMEVALAEARREAAEGQREAEEWRSEEVVILKRQHDEAATEALRVQRDNFEREIEAIREGREEQEVLLKAEVAAATRRAMEMEEAAKTAESQAFECGTRDQVQAEHLAALRSQLFERGQEVHQLREELGAAHATAAAAAAAAAERALGAGDEARLRRLLEQVRCAAGLLRTGGVEEEGKEGAVGPGRSQCAMEDVEAAVGDLRAACATAAARCREIGGAEALLAEQRRAEAHRAAAKRMEEGLRDEVAQRRALSDAWLRPLLREPSPPLRASFHSLPH